MAHQARAYLSFYSIKQTQVFLFHPGWDASQASMKFARRVSIYTSGWREVLWTLSVFSKNTTQCPWPRLKPEPFDPESSALTMRPPRLPPLFLKLLYMCQKSIFTICSLSILTIIFVSYFYSTAECHLGKLLIDVKYQLDLSTRRQCISEITIYKRVTDVYEEDLQSDCYSRWRFWWL